MGIFGQENIVLMINGVKNVERQNPGDAFNKLLASDMWKLSILFTSKALNQCLIRGYIPSNAMA